MSKTRTTLFSVATLLALLLVWSSCGRSPSRLLRQGQLPLTDFPLYVSEGTPGRIWKYDVNGTRTQFASGLNEPRGLATDQWGNLWVAEQGANRVIKINISTGVITPVATGLQQPTIIAVNSFGEAYVTQETLGNIIRVSDSKVIGTFPGGLTTGLAFGVNDTVLVADFNNDRVYWGASPAASAATVTDPVNVVVDQTGRIYVAEGAAANARVYRYQQDNPSVKVTVADLLQGPQGIAIDPAQNIYVMETGTNRIVLVTYDGQLFQWVTGIVDGQYLAFTQY